MRQYLSYENTFHFIKVTTFFGIRLNEKHFFALRLHGFHLRELRAYAIKKWKPSLRIGVPKLGICVPRLGMSIPRLGIELATCLWHFYNKYLRTLLYVSCNFFANVYWAGNLCPVAGLPFFGRATMKRERFSIISLTLLN